MKNFRVEFKWAIIFSVFTLLWMYFEKSMGWHDQLIAQHQIYTNFIAIPYIIIFYFALKEKRDKHFKGIMSWKQGLISGSVISVIIAVLAPFVQYISNEIISPEYFRNAIDYAVQNKKMTQENAEMYFNLNSYVIQAVFGSLAIGVVTSAIVALFVKKTGEKKELHISLHQDSNVINRLKSKKKLIINLKDITRILLIIFIPLLVTFTLEHTKKVQASHMAGYNGIYNLKFETLFGEKIIENNREKLSDVRVSLGGDIPYNLKLPIYFKGFLKDIAYPLFLSVFLLIAFSIRKLFKVEIQ